MTSEQLKIQTLATAIAGAAKAIEASAQNRDTFAVITEQALKAIPGTEWAAISVTHLAGARDVIAASSPVATKAEGEQLATGEGPCIDSAVLRATAGSSDVSVDHRYPRYGPAAGDVGIRAQLSLEIFRSGANRTGLNLYSSASDAFSDSVEAAELYASLAMIALGFAKNVSDLHEGLDTRSRIGQAIGIIRERFTLDEHAAFSFIVRTSQDSNVKVAAVAEKIIATVGNPNGRI